MKFIGTEDGAREYQPLALEVVGGLDIGEYDYSELRGIEPITDPFVRKGDLTLQGYVWDDSPAGIVIRSSSRHTEETTYRTIKWGEELRIQRQNPTGTVVGWVGDQMILEKV